MILVLDTSVIYLDVGPAKAATAQIPITRALALFVCCFYEMPSAGATSAPPFSTTFSNRRSRCGLGYNWIATNRVGRYQELHSQAPVLDQSLCQQLQLLEYLGCLLLSPSDVLVICVQ